MRKRLIRLFSATAVLTSCAILNASAQNTSPYWSMAGNSNVTSSTKLGTTNAVSLRLYTKNAERLRIDTLGRVGIGLTAFKGKLTVLNNGSSPASTWVSGTPLFAGYGENTAGNSDYILSMASNTSTARPVLFGKRSRGTLAVPSIVSNNDHLTSLIAGGYDGKAFQYTAGMDLIVDGTPTTGFVPARISFSTGHSSSSRVERLRIASNGNIAFNTNQLSIQKATGAVGIGTTAPESQLHVVGKTFIANFSEGFGGYTKVGDSDYGLVVKSEYGAIYGEATSKGPPMLYGQGIGVTGDGFWGVQGTGEIGVRAIGSGDGIDRGIGVYAEARGTGIEAHGNLFGVQGYAVGTEDYGYGGYFINGNGNGLYAQGGGEGSLAALFGGNVYASGVFESSDGNLKQNIKEFSNALSIIGKLKPRNYEFKSDTKLAALRLPQGTHYGLIAQDVEEVLPNLVKDVRHSVYTPKPKQFADKTKVGGTLTTEEQKRQTKETIITKALNYTELIPILVKGMQEQDQQNKQQDLENKSLRDEVVFLKERLNKLEALLTKTGTGTVNLTSAYLEQNTPNPVNGTTTIRYQVPSEAGSASIVLTNAKGQGIKTITISNKGRGQVTINSASYAAGTYNYTLYVDGQQVDTKRLVIAR